MKKQTGVLLIVLALIVGYLFHGLLSKQSTENQGAAAVLSTKDTTITTPPIIAQPGPVDVDSFIKSLPAKIVSLQGILKDPNVFKSEVQKTAPNFILTTPLSGSGKATQHVYFYLEQGSFWCNFWSFNTDVGHWVLVSTTPAPCVTGSGGVNQVYQLF